MIYISHDICINRRIMLKLSVIDIDHDLYIVLYIILYICTISLRKEELVCD